MGRKRTNEEETKRDLTMDEKVKNAKDKYDRSQNKSKSKAFNKSNDKKGKAAKEKKPSDRAKPKMNDAKWYMPDGAIMNNYNYALEGMLGIPSDLSDTKDVAEKNPTIMSIGFVHTPGDTSRDILNFAQPATASINVGGKTFYIKLSSQNKKTTGYQPQDVTLAIFAEAELISIFSMAVRLYGVALQYNAKNKDVPRELIRAMGIDPDSILVNSNDGMSLSDYRDALNVLAQAANGMPFVGGIKAFEKAWAMFSSYYCDDPVNMAQLYVPYMSKVGVYTETEDEEHGLVKSIKYESLGDPSSPITAKAFLSKVKKLIDALQQSSLMNYVYPDILNFMLDKGAGAFSFPILSDMYVIAPEYNELWLTQIHNLDFPGNPTFGDIVQDPANNIIKTQISWELNCETALMGRYVDFPFTENPSVEDKIDAMMFKVAVRGENGASYPKVPNYQSCSDYVPFAIHVLGCREILASLSKTHLHWTDTQVENIAHLFSKFKAAPIIYVYDPSTKEFKYTIGSLSTFGIVRYGDIKPMFDQAMLGLFTYDAENTYSK